METPVHPVFGHFPTVSPHDREKNLEERRRDAILIVGIELAVGVIGFAVALRAYMITTNIKAGAYWSHIALLLACLLLIIGISLQHQGKLWMVVGMVTNVIGILMAFIGTLVDGAQAGHLAQTKFPDCAYSYETEEVSCYYSGPDSTYNCFMPVYSNSCYCCYVYRENHCDTSGFSLSTQPTIFRDVDSCGQVEEEYQILLWASMSFNLVQFIVATVSVSLVGRYKSLVSQRVHPNNLQQIAMAPSLMTGSLSGGSVVIFNQQTVGYFPHVTNPPAYSEAVGPPPAQPGHVPPITTTRPITTTSQADCVSGLNHREVYPNISSREMAAPSYIATQGSPQYHTEENLPPPYSP